MSARSSSPLSSPPRQPPLRLVARRMPVLADSETDTDNDGFPADQAPEDLNPEEVAAGDPEPVNADDVGVEPLSTDGEDHGDDLLDFVVPPGAPPEEVPANSTAEESAVSSQGTESTAGEQNLEDDPDGDYLPPGAVPVNAAVADDGVDDDDGGYEADGSSDAGSVHAAGQYDEDDQDDAELPHHAEEADLADAARSPSPLDPPSDPASDSGSDSDFTIIGIKRAACFKTGNSPTADNVFPIFKKIKA